MQIFTRKAAPVRMSQWNGGHDEQVVKELRDFGFTVVFQIPALPTEREWDEVNAEEIEVPAKDRLVVIGKYNWDVNNFAPGQYVLFRLVNIETGDEVEWTDENLNDPTNRVTIFTRMADHVAKNFDLVG